MNELPWGDPARVRKLTLMELYCLSSPKPPGAPKKLKTFEEREAAYEARRRAESAWEG
jgi:hypothetical protein